MAKKYQFVFADFLLEKTEIPDIICSNISECQDYLLDVISLKLKVAKNTIKTFEKVVYKNITYKSSYFVATKKDDVYKIVNIVVSQLTVYLVCQQVLNSTYLKHYTAFEIIPNDKGEYSVLKLDELIGPPATLINTAKGKFMLRFKETI